MQVILPIAELIPGAHTEAEHHDHSVPMTAQNLIDSVPWLTNSMIVTVIVTILLVIFARRATRRMQMVPTGSQNFFEAIVEMLYDTFEGIVGKHMIGKVFPLLASLFLFILAANWFGLMPGIGTVGLGPKTGPLTVKYIEAPMLRPATADLNMNLALAALFMGLWLWWTIRELGVGGFAKHTFAPKGGLKGTMALALFPIFIFVGVIELISIAFRPISLSLRLFGNVFAGESLLHTMATLGDALPAPLPHIMSVLLPLPFYFLELLVGLLQALVFTLLCAVYIQLSTAHDEEEEHGHAH